MRLLHRTTRKLSLTVAGEAYHRPLRGSSRRSPGGAGCGGARAQRADRLRATCPVTVAQTTLAPLLPGFLQAHPRVRIDMQVTNRAVDLVDEGIDVALRVRATLEDSGSLVV